MHDVQAGNISFSDLRIALCSDHIMHCSHELEVGPTANYIFQTLLFEVGNIRSWFVNDRSALYAPCVATRTLLL